MEETQIILEPKPFHEWHLNRKKKRVKRKVARKSRKLNRRKK